MDAPSERPGSVVKTLSLLCALVFCSSGAPAQSSTTDTISDAALLDYASQGYDKRAQMFKRVVLGTNHGLQVIANFPCSDLCPDDTVRVIHYDVPLSACSNGGGVVKELVVPMGIAMGPERFCFPKVLVDNWDRYVR
jgi:hypothetical protein